MEYLRDGSIDEAAPQKETSKAIAIIESAEEKESAVELQAPEAWPDQKDEAEEGTSEKWLNWLKVIGNHGKYYRKEKLCSFNFFQRRRFCLVPSSSLV